jgi:myo-inositol-1(or 4)-monophosphatase
MIIDQPDVERVISIAREAGELVLSMQRAGLQNVSSKSNANDLVTEADLASEQLIRTALAVDFPGVGFWGEESNQLPDEETFWLVDPIDGTVNYAHGVPYFAVNIALNKGGETLLAVTLALPSGTIYWGQAGEGAYVRNGNGDARLQVNTLQRLQDSLLSTGFPYTRAETADNNAMEFAYFMPRCRGVRRMGTAAVDLALVASGVFAAHWEGDLNPWDIAPGALLIREAGGCVTDYEGNDWTHANRQFIASNGNPLLHASMVEGIFRARALLHEISPTA